MAAVAAVAVAAAAVTTHGESLPLYGALAAYRDGLETNRTWTLGRQLETLANRSCRSGYKMRVNKCLFVPRVNMQNI